MKRIYGLASALLLCVGAFAQATYTSDTLSITTAGGQGVITFANTQTAYSAGVLTVYTKGDFGASTEYVDVIDENATNLGQATSSNDCEGVYDQTVFNVSQADINTWTANGSITFTMDASAAVNICSPFASVYATLEYTDCPGTPVNFTASNYSMCADAAAVTLTPNITGGTFSGPGVTGSTFDPTVALVGSHTILYTYFDAVNNCNLTYDTVITVTNSLVANDTAICVDGSANLYVNGARNDYIWYDNAMTQVGTGATLAVGPLNASTSYFVSGASPSAFYVDSIYPSTGVAVDHNSVTGDDRGGIAVTPNYVYINGDQNIARYDVDMTNPITLTRNDGLFSDLISGKLFALFNTTTGYPQGTSVTNFSVDAIVGLDDMLNPTDTTMLSQTIVMSGASVNTSQAGIYAGAGFAIVYTGTASTEFFHIDLTTGAVTNLGTNTFTTKRANENWSHWGFADSTGGDYYVVYRSSTGNQIDRMNLTTFTASTVETFTNLSDMASITYSPWNKRIYFHNEGNNQWSGGAEMGGYIEANHISSGTLTAYGSCLGESVVSVSICAGVDEAAAGLGVNVFPNPSKGMFTVQLEENTNVNAIVTDVFGKVVYNESLINATQHTVDLTHLSKGMYFLQLVDGAKNVTKRLVIQ